MAYKAHLEAMLANDTAGKAKRWKPYVIIVMDMTGTEQVRPFWAKDCYDAVQQCIMVNGSDMIKSVHSLDDPDNQK
jgi:hypothetical protein